MCDEAAIQLQNYIYISHIDICIYIWTIIQVIVSDGVTTEFQGGGPPWSHKSCPKPLRAINITNWAEETIFLQVRIFKLYFQVTKTKFSSINISSESTDSLSAYPYLTAVRGHVAFIILEALFANILAFLALHVPAWSSDLGSLSHYLQKA